MKTKTGNILQANKMVIRLYHCPTCDYEAGLRIHVINHIITKHNNLLERGEGV